MIRQLACLVALGWYWTGNSILLIQRVDSFVARPLRHRPARLLSSSSTVITPHHHHHQQQQQQQQHRRLVATTHNWATKEKTWKHQGWSSETLLRAEAKDSFDETFDEEKRQQPKSKTQQQSIRKRLALFVTKSVGHRLFDMARCFRRRVRPVLLALVLSSAPMAARRPPPALASAPVMALPKADTRDPATDAMMEHERRRTQQAQAELKKFNQQARQLEATQGEAARRQFELEYQQQQQSAAQQKLQDLEQLKRNLLDQGIDPFCDLEGRRQVIFMEKGLDLGQVPGTPFHLDQQLEKSNSPKCLAVQKQAHRKILQCMVQDLKNHDRDPLEYFAKHQDRTIEVLDLPLARAQALLQKYQTNLELYGQVVPPKEGEMSILEKKRLQQEQQEEEKRRFEQQNPALLRQQRAKEAAAQKAAAAAEKAALKEQAQLAKAKAKAEAQAAKELAKEQAKQAKELAKQEKLAAAAATAAAATSAAAAAVAQAASSIPLPETPAPLESSSSSASESIQSSVGDGSGSDASTVGVDQQQSGEDKGEISSSSAAAAAAAAVETVASSRSLTVQLQNLPMAAKASAVVVAAAGGAYGINVLRERAARDEAERQRQFRLLMGLESDQGKKSSTKLEASSTTTKTESSSSTKKSIKPNGAGDGDKDDVVDLLESKSASPSSSSSDSASSGSSDTTKERKLGLKNVFSKKKTGRATDLMSFLEDPNNKAPEFTVLLAKILTLGAPGRFPKVLALPKKTFGENDVPADMSMEVANQRLMDARSEAGLTAAEAADIFANVVNCMLIEIVDLASSSLKEKDDQATADAIRIVVDFMNHAASLYNAVAEGFRITPVTYSGSLSKSKLEQMYSAYAISSMMDWGGMSSSSSSGTDENLENQVRLLQDVFQINEAKAEGLLRKAMQKNMAKVLKSEEGLESMEELMKGMGGGSGGDDAAMLASLLGGGGGGGTGSGGDGPTPEQLKEMLVMLKQLKDSGSIPPAELETVKSQFREAFGSSIDEVLHEADGSSSAMSSKDKELLDLMKYILQD